MSRQVVHGGDVEKVARKYGFSMEEIIDFSSNINPLPLPEKARDYVLSRWREIARYPDREYHELRTALAHYTGYSPEWISVGNGATELIYLAMRTLNPRRVLLPAPSFAEYEQALAGRETRIDFFPLREEADFQLNVEAFAEKLKEGYDLAVLCNPNNPTGQLVAPAGLKLIVEEACRRGTYLLLDETFIEFVPDVKQSSMLPILADYDKLMLVRAFTKFFAMPGLRLGYCLAHPSLQARMAEYKEPWTVNVMAALLGAYLVKDEDYIARTRAWIASERPYCYRELKKLPDLKVIPSTANFLLLKLTGQRTLPELKNLLLNDAIMIRDAGSFRYLNDRFFRVAIKDRVQNEKLLEALHFYL